MLPLRHAGLWRVLSGLILIAVLLAAVSPAFWFDSKVSALKWFHNADKWLHGVTFTVLALWFSGMFDRRIYWRIAIFLTLFGFFLEFCQLQVSYRTADWIDIGANTAGIIVGLTIAMAGFGGWGLRLEDWYSRRL